MPIQQASFYCLQCRQQRLFTRQGANHILHLIVSLFLCGLWIPVWILIAIADGNKAYFCSQCGYAGSPSALANPRATQQRLANPPPSLADQIKASSAYKWSMRSENTWKVPLIVAGIFLLLGGFLVLAALMPAPKKESQADQKSQETAIIPKATPVPATPKTKETQKQPPVTTRAASNDIAEYNKLIRSIDAKGDIVKSASEGLTPDQIKITIANSWHYEPYQVRLQLAQKLWEAWARLHSPGEPDKARIKIVDLNGNEVGGSRILAGSLIWVQE